MRGPSPPPVGSYILVQNPVIYNGTSFGLPWIITPAHWNLLKAVSALRIILLSERLGRYVHVQGRHLSAEGGRYIEFPTALFEKIPKQSLDGPPRFIIFYAFRTYNNTTVYYLLLCRCVFEPARGILATLEHDAPSASGGSSVSLPISRILTP